LRRVHAALLSLLGEQKTFLHAKSCAQPALHTLQRSVLEGGSRMPVSREDVLHVAALARLEVAPEQVESFQRELGAILEHFQKLNELDTSNVEPTSHALALVNVFREDVPQPSLTQEEALANAPQKAFGHFRVPKVID